MPVWSKHPAVLVVAAVAAVLGGLSGIALGSWLSWTKVDDLAPGPAASTAIARQVLPVHADGPSYFGRHTFWNPYSDHTLHGGTGVRVGNADFTGTAPDGARYQDLITTVERRLRAQGWHDVTSYDTMPGLDLPQLSQASVTGRRDGYLLWVTATEGDPAGPDPDAARLTLYLMWDAPPDQPAWTVAGGVAGALLGVLLGWWTARRMRGRPPGMRLACWLLCGFVLLTLAPACLGNIPTPSGSWLSATSRDVTGPPVFWGGFVIYAAEPLAILSVLPILAVLVLTAWPRREVRAGAGR
jgi:hypothetical protein